MTGGGGASACDGGACGGREGAPCPWVLERVAAPPMAKGLSGVTGDVSPPGQEAWAASTSPGETEHPPVLGGRGASEELGGSPAGGLSTQSPGWKGLSNAPSGLSGDAGA